VPLHDGALPTNEDREGALRTSSRRDTHAGAHCAADTFYKVPAVRRPGGAYFDAILDAGGARQGRTATIPETKQFRQIFTSPDEILPVQGALDGKKLHVTSRSPEPST